MKISDWAAADESTRRKMQGELWAQTQPQRLGIAACSGKFADGRPCPAAAECDRYLRGLVSTSPRQVWNSFEPDETGEKCEEAVFDD
jgi:hypothetical protein